MRALIVRNLSFAVCASAFWALLPVIARDQLGLGAGGYGLLSAGFGIGAVVGRAVDPAAAAAAHRSTPSSRPASCCGRSATLLVAATSTDGARARRRVLLRARRGSACSRRLSAGTQSAAPAWVRARAVAMNLVAVQASLAIGSALWGALASAFGTRIALAASAGAHVRAARLNRRVRVEMGKEADVTPGVQLPELAIAVQPLPDDGPVLIQIEYQIDPENRAAFLQRDPRGRGDAPAQRRGELARLSRPRRGRPLRRALHHLTSWAEYVRLRTRMTMADRKIAGPRGGIPAQGRRRFACRASSASTSASSCRRARTGIR